MVTLGAPSLGFLREIGQADAEGPTLDRLIEIAGRHGLRPVMSFRRPSAIRRGLSTS